MNLQEIQNARKYGKLKPLKTWEIVTWTTSNGKPHCKLITHHTKNQLWGPEPEPEYEPTGPLTRKACINTKYNIRSDTFRYLDKDFNGIKTRSKITKKEKNTILAHMI